MVAPVLNIQRTVVTFTTVCCQCLLTSH